MCQCFAAQHQNCRSTASKLSSMCSQRQKVKSSMYITWSMIRCWKVKNSMNVTCMQHDMLPKSIASDRSVEEVAMLRENPGCDLVRKISLISDCEYHWLSIVSRNCRRCLHEHSATLLCDQNLGCWVADRKADCTSWPWNVAVEWLKAGDEIVEFMLRSIWPRKLLIWVEGNRMKQS